MTPDPIAIELSDADRSAAFAKRQSSAWDIRNAPKNYFYLVVFQIGSALFSFASVWLLTRFLGADGYGGIVAVIAASQVAQVFANWTGIAVVRFGVDEFIETEKIARTFWVRLIVLAINLVLVLLLAGFWFPPLADWLKLSPASLWLVLAHFAVSALWLHIQMSLQAAKMPRVQGFLQMIERLLIFAGFLILILVGRLDFFWAVTCYIAVPAVMVLIGLFQIKGYILSRFSIGRPFIRKVIMYSAPLAPMAIVGYFSGSYLDAIFVSKFLSIRDLGIYSVATQINGIALQIPTLANSLLIPLFISLEKEQQTHKIRRFFRDVLPTLVLIWGFLCAVAAFIGFYLIPLVFGAEFYGSVSPLWILLAASGVGLPILIGYSALSHSLSATYMSMWAAIFAAAANIIFNFLLIPRFGVIGCAWATLVAYFVSMLTLGLLLRRSKVISLSWVLLAMAPPIVGAVVISMIGSAVTALLSCAGLVVLISYLKKAAFRETLQFLRNLTE